MDHAYEVELQNVTKLFGDVVAVESVTLCISQGEFLTLLGPSGCGKTTLLRMIAGFEIPTEGRVVLGGQDVTNLPPYRRDVTTVFQHYALFPHLNVFENVAFGLERRGDRRDEIKRRVADALDMVQLDGFETRRTAELSGGQQQRVALARALVLEPRVLLLDEPLAALDLKLRKQMQVELKALQRRLGISFIFVTHDQEEALVMSDRVVVMNSGRIEQMGRAEDIYERPATEFVADFIGVSNIIEGIVETCDGQVSIISFSGARVEVRGENIEPGQRVRIMVRPEKISLSAQGTAGLLTGAIDSAVYLGESTQWKVVIAGGRQITVLEQNRAPAGSVANRVGQVVEISWEPESAVVLRR
jgi:spermidine/putrescine transport system ATP-binding protein